MKKYIVVTADTNDGDYTIEKTEISDDKIKKIQPMIQAIKDFKPYESDYSTNHYKGTYPNGKVVSVTSKKKNFHNFVTHDLVRADMGELDAEEYYTKRVGIPKDVFNLFYEYTPYGEYGIHTIVSVEIITVTKEEKLL